MKMQIFFVARCLLFFCSVKHLSFTLTDTERQRQLDLLTPDMTVNINILDHLKCLLKQEIKSQRVESLSYLSCILYLG